MCTKNLAMVPDYSTLGPVLDLMLLFDLLTPHLDHPQLTEREGKIRIP